MPFNDGIPRYKCFSLTDFNEFEFCPFRFFVKHHLEKKYEVEEGNESSALGNILDQSIKIFHKSKAYGQPVEYLPNLVKRAVYEIRERVAQSSGKPSFYSSTAPFITEELIEKACRIFQDYYRVRKGRIRQSLGEVGFCEYVIEGEDGKVKLWGGPDAYELGDDGVPEVCDYKFREDMEKGKNNMDMDLMPKIYVLLASKYLLSKGYERARFVVRFWTEALNEDFYEEFDLSTAENMADLFKQKMHRILTTTEVSFCEKDWCKVCSSPKRNDFLRELISQGFIGEHTASGCIQLSGEELLG